MALDELPELITVGEMAKALRVSKMTAYRLCNDGKIPTYRFGRTWRVSREAFDAYLAAAASPATVPVALTEALAQLAEEFDQNYHNLRGNRVENETCQDEIDDAVADTYIEGADRIRALLKEHT